MAQRQELRWKGAPAPRAKAIPQEKWEEHKDEFCELYQKMTLDDLMTMVRIRHRFTASRRQFVSQFSKWGVYKYGPTEKEIKQPESGEERPAHSSESKADQDIEDTQSSVTRSFRTHLRKRPLSSSEKPHIPPKKRLSDFVPSEDPFRDPDCEIDTARLSLPSGSLSRHSVSLHAVMPTIPTSGQTHGAEYRNDEFSGSKEGRITITTDRRYRKFASTNGSVGESETGIEISQQKPHNFRESGYTSSLSACAASRPTNQFGIDNSDADCFIRLEYSRAMLNVRNERQNSRIATVLGAYVDSGHEPDKSFLADRWYDINRPIDTFSPTEMEDMKCAADFLFCMKLYVDAFPLYVLLLKRLKVTPKTIPQAEFPLIIACARSAVTSSQTGIARHLLEQKLQDPSTTDLERFFFRLLLAYTHAFYGFPDNKDKLTAQFHIASAIRLNSRNETVIEDLPESHRAFDLMMYHFVTGRTEELNGVAVAKDCNSRQRTGVLFAPGVVESPMLEDDPSPSENVSAEDGLNNIPYVHLYSDTRLAQEQLLQRKPGAFQLEGGRMKIPYIRTTLDWCAIELEFGDRIPDLWAALQAYTTGLKNAVSLDHLRIFFHLWECLQTQTRSRLEQWTSQVESLMGISATEHLSIICWMIAFAAPGSAGSLKSENDLVLAAPDGVKILLEQSDEELGSQYLETFASLNRWCGGKKERVAKYQHHKSSRIYLPEVAVRDPTIIYPEGQSLGMAVAALLPTLAPSLHSSDLSSFRGLRDRIQQSVKGAMENAALAMPSAVLRRSSRSNLSMFSVDELSQAMARSSLSLSIKDYCI